MNNTVYLTGYANNQPITLNGNVATASVVLNGTVSIAGAPGRDGQDGQDGTGGGGGSSSWGGITGTLGNQTDLQAALDAKLTKTSNLSDITNPAQARNNLGLAIGSDVEAAITAATVNDYIRGDKTVANFNTAVRSNRLDQLSFPTAPVDIRNQRLTLVANPISSQDAATKSYVDAVVQGLNPKGSVIAATTTTLPANTYASNVITASGNAALVVDGVTLSDSDRLLVKDEASAIKNGIYVVTDNGSVLTPYVLTRSDDMDANTEVKGAFTFVTSGSVNANKGYTVTAQPTYILGTDSINFTQFSSAITPDATTLVKGKAYLGAATGAATFESDALKAPLASPTFTGTPTVPTAATTTSTTQAASTAFVQNLVKTTTLFTVAPYGSTRPANYTCAGATNNQVEIQQAIDAATALPNGGTVLLLDGTFVNSASIMRKPNVHIRGAGITHTKVTSIANGNFNIFDMNKAVYNNNNPLLNSYVEEMEIDGSNFDPASAVKAINGGNFRYCKIYRIYAHDTTATGIGDDDFYGTTVDHCIVENCGYTNKRIITAVAYSSGTFTYSTAAPHGYSAWTTATGTLTASGTISDGDTVTIGHLIYTFKTTLTGAAYEVLINGSAANALINLKAAVNLTGSIGTDYGLGTIENPDAIAGAITSTTLVFSGTGLGDTDNTTVTTETGANLSWGAATLTGGIDGNRITVVGMAPTLYNGQFLVSSVLDSTHFTVSNTINSTNLNLGSDPGTATAFGSSSDTIIGHNGIGIASGALTSEACIVTNCVCIGNQNNNFLIEADANFSGAEVSYIFTNCISFRAGNKGFLNTGSLNAQFNFCYDYGSLTGGRMESVSSFRPIASASWSAGVATFGTTLAYLFAVGKKVQVSGMIPTAYNGFYTIQSTPTTTSFTVNLASDPGTAVAFGTTSFEVHPVDGSSFNSPVFESNTNYGIDIPNSGVQAKNVVIKNSKNYGVRILNSSYIQLEGRIYGSGRDGVLMQTSNAAAGPMSHVSIVGHIYNNGVRIASSDGIDISPSSATAIQNVDINVHAFDDQDVKTQRYGIALRNSGTLTNINVRGNLDSNATAPILLQNSSTSISIDNVIGVNPEGRSALGNVSGSVTFDIATANFFTATLTGNLAPVMPNSVVHGSKMTWVLIQDATGSRTISVPVNAATGTTLTLSTTAAAVDVLTWVYDGTSSKWRLLSKTLGNPSVGTLDNLVVTTPSAGNKVSLNVTQNDTTNNPDGADITNAGTSHALKILQNGILASSKYALFIDSAAAQTVSALVRYRNSSGSTTQATLQLDNSGTGASLLLNSGKLSMTGGVNVEPSTTTGTKYATATTQKQAWWNATPVVQPSGNLLTAIALIGLVATPTIAEADVTNLVTDLAAKQPLDSDLTTLAANITAAGHTMVAAANAAAQTALLDSFTSSLKGLVPASGGGTTNFLRADGTFAAPAAVTDIDVSRKRPFISCDFLVTGSGSSDPFLGVAIASGTLNTPSVAASTHHPGLARFRSSTTTNSGYLIGTNTTQLLLGGGEVFEAVFEIDTLASSTFRVGYLNTTTSADAVDGVYVEIASTGIATGKTANNSTRSSTGTTYTLSLATYYRIKIVVTSTSSVTYYIYNDAGTQLWTDTLTANIPSTRSTGAGVNATNVGTTALDLLHLDYMALNWTSDRTR